jgi:hypothetical protein
MAALNQVLSSSGIVCSENSTDNIVTLLGVLKSVDLENGNKLCKIIVDTDQFFKELKLELDAADARKDHRMLRVITELLGILAAYNDVSDLVSSGICNSVFYLIRSEDPEVSFNSIFFFSNVCGTSEDTLSPAYRYDVIDEISKLILEPTFAFSSSARCNIVWSLWNLTRCDTVAGMVCYNGPLIGAVIQMMDNFGANSRRLVNEGIHFIRNLVRCENGPGVVLTCGYGCFLTEMLLDTTDDPSVFVLEEIEFFLQADSKYGYTAHLVRCGLMQALKSMLYVGGKMAERATHMLSNISADDDVTNSHAIADSGILRFLLSEPFLENTLMNDPKSSESIFQILETLSSDKDFNASLDDARLVERMVDVIVSPSPSITDDTKRRALGVLSFDLSCYSGSLSRLQEYVERSRPILDAIKDVIERNPIPSDSCLEEYVSGYVCGEDNFESDYFGYDYDDY